MLDTMDCHFQNSKNQYGLNLTSQSKGSNRVSTVNMQAADIYKLGIQKLLKNYEKGLNKYGNCVEKQKNKSKV